MVGGVCGFGIACCVCVFVVVQSKPACVYSLVDVQRGLLCEPFHAQVALEGPFAGVHSHVDVEVRLATEGRRTLLTLERPSLD